ncbi:MAG: hypothetical protein L6R42_004898 [Xanthoria sp. 1 TBL-2021]|nr:MAG: hypothetical protein L6R42_004898 [Xanthoria sp. 1 TBL-2021]
MSTHHSTTSLPDPQYDHLITLLHTKIPQELLDQIENTVYEMVFCPGYLYFNVSGQENADTDVQKSTKVARPELLCLSKSVHRRYAVRMWQENICIVKTESGRMLEITHVKGHLAEPLPVLYSLSDETGYIDELRQDMECINYTKNGENRGYYWDSLPEHGLSLETLTEQTISSAIKLNRVLDRLNLKNTFRCDNLTSSDDALKHKTLCFGDSYGPSGEWTGLELSHSKLVGNWPQGKSRSMGIMWKAVSMMTGRMKDCHELLVPEMANQNRQVRVGLFQIRDKVYVFT